MAAATVAEGTRACKKCGEEKPIGAFKRHPRYAGGFTPRCKKCLKAAQRLIVARRQQEFRESGATELTCRKCKRVRPLALFNKLECNYTGYDVECRECRGRRPPRTVVLVPTSKFCKGCKQEHSAEDFYRSRYTTDGLSAKCRACSRDLNRRCREVRKQIVARWRDGGSQADIEREFPGERGRFTSRATLLSFARRLVGDARTRAPGGECDLTAEWFLERVQNGRCAVTGLQFDLSVKRGPFSPSLDRKAPGGPYTAENTQVVCLIYNLAKHAWSHEDVITLARGLLAQEQADDRPAGD